MNLRKDNEQISLSGEKAIKILTDVEYMLVSLRDITRYYYSNVNGNISAKDRALYFEETTKFIDDNEIAKKLANIREIITEKFNLELGDDDMDDIEREREREREREGVTYWKPHLK